MKSTGTPSGTRAYRQGARAEAAEATGQAIVDAFIVRLMAMWYDEITLDLVAKDAGVTVQTVVRRFKGKEGLLAEAAKVLGAQIKARRAAPAGDLARSLDNLVKDYEQTGDAVIRLLALEARQPAVSVCLNFGRGEHRSWVDEVAADGLTGLTGATRERALDALVLVTDVYAWKLLRRDMGYGSGAVATAMKRLVRATIEEFVGRARTGETR